MEISEIKARLTLETVVSSYGLKPDAQQRLRCPWHEDRTPSLQLYPATKSWTCFSSNCMAGSGDVIDFIQKYEQLTKHEALKKAARLAGSPLAGSTTDSSTVAPETVMTNGHTMSAEERTLVLEHYWRVSGAAMKRNSGAQSYMKKRGLITTEAGYSTTTQQATPASGQFLTKLKSVGLINQDTTAFARNCVIFPLKDNNNQIVSIYGRSIKNNDGAKHYYLKDRTGLYPAYPKGDTEILILTESVIDAASMIEAVQNKKTSVLALYGTNGWTVEHDAAIQHVPSLTTIVLFFDGDEAGRAAALKYHKQLTGRCTVHIINTPDGEDINSILMQHGAEYLQTMIQDKTFFLSMESGLSLEKPSPEIVPEKLHSIENGSQENTLVKSDSIEKENDIIIPSGSFDSSNANALVYVTETARYEILGGIGRELDALKVTLKVEHTHGVGSMARLRLKCDLYNDEQSEKTAKRVAEKLALRHDYVERDILALTDILEAYRTRTQSGGIETVRPKAPAMSATETQQAVAFLKQPELLTGINDMIGQSGMVGEEANRLLMFLCFISYRRERPLHVVSQGASGQGKTHLQERVARLIPKEDRIEVTRMSEYSFYHFGEYELRHKLLIIEDLDGLGEEAMLALREMQSKGWIAGGVTAKDEKGNFATKYKVVSGPLATAGATTKGDLYEDNSNRCFVLAVDESEEQTTRIIQYQNRVSAGRIDTRVEDNVCRFMQNCVRVLHNRDVVNPYAEYIAVPEEIMKRRRMNAHYHELIRVIVWLHQYQRERDGEGRLIATKEDIRDANRLIIEALVRKADELDGSLRLFYERLKTYIQTTAGGSAKGDGDNYGFTQREVRQALRVSKTQMQRYLLELLGLEYIRISSGIASKGYSYRILVWDDGEELKKRMERKLDEQLAAIEI